MPDTPSHVAFYGDAEHEFRLDPAMIAELEKVTGRGIGGLTRDIFSGNFRLAEITETIRLALVGGGTDPETAASLVRTYSAARPVMESYALAVAIVELTMLGKPATPAKRGRK